MPETMRPGCLRRLTARERALAEGLFGGAVDAGRVRVFAIPVWNRAFVPSGRLMVWPAREALADFADPAVPLARRAVFAHELAHVWQGQNGVFLPLAKLKAGDGQAAYAYDPATPFAATNIEQQAMVVQNAFLRARGDACAAGALVWGASARRDGGWG